MDYLPAGLVTAFALVGAYTVGSKVISYVQLLLSLFVLSGANVSIARELCCSIM